MQIEFVFSFFLDFFNLKNGMVGKHDVFSCAGGVLHSRCDLCWF